MEQLLKREDVAVEDTWDLERVYADETAWQTEFEETRGLVQAYGQKQGTVTKDREVVRQLLDAYYELSRKANKLFVYASERRDQDTTNSTYQKMADQAYSLMVQVDSASAFLEPELLALGEDWLKEAMDSEELSFYKRVLELMLRGNAHTLKPEQEQLLAEAGVMSGAPRELYQMFNTADLRFPEAVDSEGNAHTLTGSTFVQLEMSSDRTLRQSAYENLYGTYDTFQNTMAGLFAANIKQASFFARSRKFASTRAYYLHDSNIPERVYDNLIETIHQNMDVMHRYVSLRKKMLGVDELHMYDVYVPLLAEFDKKYSFAEAQKMVKEGLQPLGEEYATLLDRAFTERWIDRYENEGKRGGAYSWGSYDTTPYVLMNYDHTLDSVFTLAHELGHSMHSYYSCSNQPYAYADYKIFVAEVASTCNEALLIRHLLAQCTDIQERAHLINHFLESFKGTVYRQTMFAEFEMICHRKVEAGETLTADGLKALYKDLNAQYFGTDMVTDDAIAMEWARIPHFYTPFYVYPYATGFSAAIALSERILTEGEPALADYKAFLKTGGSMDPIEELRIAGVDMEQPQPIKKALDLFAELVTEMEQICEQL